MRKWTVREARSHFSALVDQAVGGTPVTITRRGKTVARLVPAAVGGRLPSQGGFRAGIRAKGRALSERIARERDER